MLICIASASSSWCVRAWLPATMLQEASAGNGYPRIARVRARYQPGCAYADTSAPDLPDTNLVALRPNLPAGASVGTAERKPIGAVGAV